MAREKQARRVLPNTPGPEKRGGRRRRDHRLSLWGTILTFSIVPLFLVGVIRNPTGLEGGALMALLAVLFLARLGVALTKMKIIRRRLRPPVPDTVPDQVAAYRSSLWVRSS